MSRRDAQPWAPVTGPEVADGLAWLERAAGSRAIQKFLGGKLRGTRFSGQYVCGIVGNRDGREVVAALLARLRLGHAVPLCDVDSYYAAGRRWPEGMRVIDGRLVDVWRERTSQDS